MVNRPHLVAGVPLVGRLTELAQFTAALEASRKGRGSVHILAGEGGVGKSRLTESVSARARERGMAIVMGRCFPVETGIPYALFADAFVTLLREMPTASLNTVSRGASAELALLFPALRPEGAVPRGNDTAELKPRLLDAFAQLLFRLARQQPMLLVLENLQWADPSSLDLFHFVARKASEHPLVMLATYNDVQRESNRGLRAAEQSLLSLGVAQRHVLAPLSRDETEELVVATFGASREAMGDFPDRVHSRTRGNPFFVEETLKALVQTGRLRRDGERWVGWMTEQLALPDSIREALQLRYDRLSPSAQQIAVLAAVVGTQVPHSLLGRLSELDDATLLAAIDELRQQRAFEEVDGPGEPMYVFSHPMLQEMLYAELGRARVRALHAAIADALELTYGAHADAHAEELAVHFRRAESPSQAARAARYLQEAGRLALARGAPREAAESLSAALALVEHDEDTAASESLLDLLGRARNRLGDYVGATAVWRRAVSAAVTRGDGSLVASLERRLGLAALRTGEFAVALDHLDRGLSVASQDDASRASLHLARSTVLMEVGRGEEADGEVRLALALAERLADPRLLARVHLALQSLAVWRGPSRAALEHGERAREFAAIAGDPQSAWSAQVTLAMHAGLTGDAPGTARHLAEAQRMAEELRSPLLRLWTAEVAIEYRSGTGEWDEALALADRTIDEARAFGQRMLLPRILGYSALIHIGRGDLDEAKRRIDEAWRLSGADRADEGVPLNVHAAVPVHVGLGYYHMYRRDFRTALEIAERGLAIADRTGYTVLGLHRLLPLAAEAALSVGDWERSTHYGNRLREAADLLGHPLARAWSDACFALERMLQGDVAVAIAQLRQAADALEAIPFVEHAARLRRKLVDALCLAGDTEGAIVELRRIHEVFAHLGARLALDEAREKLRELGARPPSRTPLSGAGVGALTGRETEIARLIADRKSNKEIGVALQISARTVGTHLANIFTKLGVRTRGELTDVTRAQGI